jgi:hypothetical protein
MFAVWKLGPKADIQTGVESDAHLKVDDRLIQSICGMMRGKVKTDACGGKHASGRP